VKEKHPARREEKPLDIFDKKYRQAINLHFHEDSVSVLSAQIDGICAAVHDYNPCASVFEFYDALCQVLPGKVSSKKQQEALQAASVPETLIIGKKVLLFLNLRTIVSGIKECMINDPSYNDELTQGVIADMYENLTEIVGEGGSLVRKKLHEVAQESAAERLAKDKGFSLELVKSKKAGEIEREINDLFKTENSYRMSGAQIDDAVQKLSGATGVRADLIAERIRERISVFPIPQEDVGEDNAFQKAADQDIKERIREALHKLSERGESVIQMRFGLEDQQEQTYKQVAGKLGVSSERVRQIEEHAISKLRHPQINWKFLVRDDIDRTVEVEKVVPVNKIVERYKNVKLSNMPGLSSWTIDYLDRKNIKTIGDLSNLSGTDIFIVLRYRPNVFYQVTHAFYRFLKSEQVNQEDINELWQSFSL